MDLYTPIPCMALAQCKVKDDAITVITCRDIHMLASVVATDDWRGNTAWGGDREAVIDAVTNKGTICSRAGD